MTFLRHARLEQRVRLARHPAHRGEHVERGVGALAEQLQQVLAIEHEQRAASIASAVAVREPPSSSDSSPKNSPASRGVQQDLLPGRVLDEQIDLAGLHDEHRVAGSPARNITLPGVTRALEHRLRQHASLVIVELREQVICARNAGSMPIVR